jgi:CotH protein/lamin tail-like protein
MSLNKHVRERCILFTVAFLVVLCSTQLGMALVVSEIMYHPVEDDGTSQGEEYLEFIELYNDRAVFEDLGGYAFTNGITFTFDPGTKLPGKEYLVVARDPNAVQTTYGITGVLGPYSGRLNNDGERVELSNENGEIIISFRYNDARPWPISPDGTGHSLILAKLGGDPEGGLNWAPSTYIGGTPGEPDEIQEEPVDPTLVPLVSLGHAGRYFKGYEEPGPGSTPTTDWAQIGFNDDPSTTDWIAGASGYGYSNDGSELQYINTVLNDMLGNYLSVYARLEFTLTQEQIDSFTELRAEVRYDDDYILYFNGTPVGNSDQIPSIPLAFDWGRPGGWDAPAANIDLTGWMHLLESGSNVLALQFHNCTGTTSSDGFGSATLDAIVEDPGGGDDPRARVVINEVLTNSDALPGTDWIELYNPGPIAVDLSNMYLSDDRFDLLLYKIPDGVVLQPGDFWAVSEGTAPDGFPFGLNYSGERLYLTAATDDPTPAPLRVLDALRYGNMEPEITFGRYPDGSENFGLLSSATIDPSKIVDHNNTPIRVSDIVINEIMYHHGYRDRRYEYIELYNRSGSTVPLEGWALTDGVEYEFGAGVEMPPYSYLVVAEDPTFLDGVYPAGNNLQLDVNLLGPYDGNLDDYSERIRLSYPFVDPNTQITHLAIADEVTYYDGGRWPVWADGKGCSLELRDPHSSNDGPDAWAESDESGKAPWENISFFVYGSDTTYSHDSVNVFGILLLNQGEVLLDDLSLSLNGTTPLVNTGFESGESSWRFLGNHIRSFVTTEDKYSGSNSLHLIATGHGDPGANRVNQSFAYATAGDVQISGKARWLRGSRYLLLRTTRETSPVQPPRPAYVKELFMPANLGTPGLQNTAFTSNRGPDIREVQHAPVLPVANEPIVVTARITDNDGIGSVNLKFRSEGEGSFTTASMVDDGSGNDLISGDRIYTATIPGAAGGTMRAFYIEASDGSASTRFPTLLQPTAEVPERTCLVRVGDWSGSTALATYRVWFSNDVINAFTSRPNLANELLDCTFVFNDTDVFYNARIRYRGSPFLRSGFGKNPIGRNAFRIDFNPEQKFRRREEINLDNTEGGSRGPLQERASYWFYRKMGLQYSMQEYVRPIYNGNSYTGYEDVQKIDGDYINDWYPDDNDGYIHKIDDYFEYTADGTGFANLDEGLKYDASHPLIPETYRWGFEKRSHREDDYWDHLFNFAVAMNTSSSNPTAYEAAIESVVDPYHFAGVLALRHACGDWDSYGYNRGKNNYFYYASEEDKWYLLPWDIDFTLGSGHGPTTNIFSVNSGQFPEVYRFMQYSKYRTMYLQFLGRMVYGPWQTSYGTANPPTPFDEFLDNAADVLRADGYNDDSRRDGIKSYVRSRRTYLLPLVPASPDFEITTNNGDDFSTTDSSVTIQGLAPFEVSDIAVTVNDTPISVSVEFLANNVFRINVSLEMGANSFALQGMDSQGDPVPDATDSITVTRAPTCTVDSVSPSIACNNGVVSLTIQGDYFTPATTPTVRLSSDSGEVGFDALYVDSDTHFDLIDAATWLLDDPDQGISDPVYAVHPLINLWNSGFHGVFPSPEYNFAAPFNTDSTSYAVRFTGYIYAPSAGIRYFGVNSDEGFSLTIAGQLVGAFPGQRLPATTDVTNTTVGTMSYDFPSSGRYYMELDYYENDGGEEIEFFQTDVDGGNPRLINHATNTDLVVYRAGNTRRDATNVVVVDEQTITCDIDMANALPDLWRLTIIAQDNESNQCSLADAVQVIEPPLGTVDWIVLPESPMVFGGPEGSLPDPSQQSFTLVNTGSVPLNWRVSKETACDWLDLPTPSYGAVEVGNAAPITMTVNSVAQTLAIGEYTGSLVFSIGCNPSGTSEYIREVKLRVSSQSDFNHDFVIDNLDLAELVNRWGDQCSEPNWCAGRDLDKNGRIDFGDYAILAQEWLVNYGSP